MLQAELEMVFDFPLYFTETLLWVDHLHSTHCGENHWSRPVSPAGGTWESNSLCHFSSLGLNIWLEGEATVDGLTVLLPFKFGMLFWSLISLSEILILITWKASRRPGIMHWLCIFKVLYKYQLMNSQQPPLWDKDVLIAMFYKGRKMRQAGETQNFNISNNLLVAVLLLPSGYLRHLVYKDAQHPLLF